MGLFDRFKKQDCEICGKEVGMFGYKKLKDGEICKDCVKLLSPWFEDRKESTVAQIKAQIAYRAQNAEELKSFNPTKVYGDFEYMYVEERDGVPYRFCVSRNKDYLKENADLVLVEDLREVIIDIDDNAHEHREDEEDPDDVTYDLDYRFSVSLLIKNNPYFNSIHFDLNTRGVEVSGVRSRYEDVMDVEDEEDVEFRQLYEELYPVFVANYRKYKTMCDEIEAMCK